MVRRLMLLTVLLWLPALAMAGIDAYEFNSDAERERYQQLIDEMRCPKCQNQNLSGSDSPIAADLRREVHRMVEGGQSNEQIIEFMVNRYGEFVLYRPRMSSATAVLWGLPVALLVLGIVVVQLLIRRRRAQVDVPMDGAERARLAALLAAAGERASAAAPEQSTPGDTTRPDNSDQARP
jgi:cytochrome c-type biogenesis protein CcmH